jgi:hypothetical protein
MRIHTALAALLLLTGSLTQVPALAQTDAHAQLRLRIVDQANAALPGAAVTVFTLDGNPAVTVTADEQGVAVFPALPVGLAQIYASVDGRSPFIEKTTLRQGRNAQTATLRAATSGDSDESGS